MLVLTRKINQQIRLGDDITITVLRVKGNSIRIGIEAPRSCRVLRAELEPHQDEQDEQAVAAEIEMQNLISQSAAENENLDGEDLEQQPEARVYQLRTSAPLASFIRSSSAGDVASLSLR